MWHVFHAREDIPFQSGVPCKEDSTGKRDSRGHCFLAVVGTAEKEPTRIRKCHQLAVDIPFLPTSWSNQAILSVAMGVAFDGLEASAAISRALEQSILSEATHPAGAACALYGKGGGPKRRPDIPIRYLQPT